MKRHPARDIHLEELMRQVSALMLEQHVTQAELARRMDTDRSSINKMLKLKSDPLLSTIAAVLEALDCKLDFSPRRR